MSLIQKTGPVGVDIVIDKIQQDLYNNLSWVDGGSDVYQCYPRAYKNETENGITPEIAVDNIDYSEVLFDDTFSATSFFTTGDSMPFSTGRKYQISVSLYFQLILTDLYPSVAHRADEEAHRDVLMILDKSSRGYNVTSVEKGIQNVYGEFYKDEIKYDDTSKFHVFRIDLETTFNYFC